MLHETLASKIETKQLTSPLMHSIEHHMVHET
jgi:hypothetical protein